MSNKTFFSFNLVEHALVSGSSKLFAVMPNIKFVPYFFKENNACEFEDDPVLFLVKED